MSRWWDTHVHLDRYVAEERGQLLARAEEAQVAIIAVAAGLESSRSVAELEGVAGRAVGIHPRHPSSGFEAELSKLAAQPGVCGIGECGFDAEGGDWEVQATAFRQQALLASMLGKCLVLHIEGGGAWEQFAAKAPAVEGLRVVRHYFCGNAAEAAWHAEREHYLSFGKPLRRRGELRDIARTYPEHLLLIETDSYPLPGRSTEPAHVGRIGETIALLRGWTFEEARDRLEQNTARAFGLEV